MLYEFEWDPLKGNANFEKHGVDFELATAAFRDPLALTIPDEEHSVDEVRWITLGRDGAGRLLLVVHTFTALDATGGRIRVISARRPTKGETRAYEEE